MKMDAALRTVRDAHGAGPDRALGGGKRQSPMLPPQLLAAADIEYPKHKHPYAATDNQAEDFHGMQFRLSTRP